MASEPKFIVRFKAVTIDKAAWQRALERELEEKIKTAAEVWLNATVLLVIPVWSGASRATFLKLARSVGFGLTVTGIRATRQDNKRALGPSVGFQQSEGSLDKAGLKHGQISFTYGTTLFHLIFNEFNNANENPVAGRLFARLAEPGPYNFQKIGQAAFEDYVKDAVKLPSPWKYLKTTAITVG